MVEQFEPATSAVQELEDAVQRLARLIVNAAALADRMAAVGGEVAWSCPERAKRIAKLCAAVDVGQRAIQAAMQHSGVERRRGERRAVPQLAAAVRPRQAPPVGT